MFGYLFARIWQNKPVRFVMLGAVLVIAFAAIFNAREGINRYFSRLLSSADWSDTRTHAGRPFAFAENESKAQQLVESAWVDIQNLAVEELHLTAAKQTLARSVQRRPYSSFLDKFAEENIFTYFNALNANCGVVKEDVSISAREDIQNKTQAQNAAALALRARQTANLKKLLKIQQTKVEAALQKKPDFLPAIELSEEIFRAACSMREIPVLLARALDYREYAIQKHIYDTDNGRLYEKNPELFYAKGTEAYGKDIAYRELLLRYFDATRFRTPYNPAQLKNLRNAYAAFQNPKTLGAFIAALLAEARHAPPMVAKKCHFELFALDYPGVTERVDYLYALAETAFRGEEFTRASNIIGNALKAKMPLDESQTRDFERLRFRLNLMVHESENISRF